MSQHPVQALLTLRGWSDGLSLLCLSIRIAITVIALETTQDSHEGVIHNNKKERVGERPDDVVTDSKS